MSAEDLHRKNTTYCHVVLAFVVVINAQETRTSLHMILRRLFGKLITVQHHTMTVTGQLVKYV